MPTTIIYKFLLSTGSTTISTNLLPDRSISVYAEIPSPAPTPVGSGYVSVTVTAPKGSDPSFRANGPTGGWDRKLLSEAVGLTVLPDGSQQASIFLDPHLGPALSFYGNGTIQLVIRDHEGPIPDQYGPLRLGRRTARTYNKVPYMSTLAGGKK